jgi:hypothetical protein
LAQNYAKPPNWEIEPCKLDESDVKNSGFQNADFIIWMRTAAFPDFRKLVKGGIRRGQGQIDIQKMDLGILVIYFYEISGLTVN